MEKIENTDICKKCGSYCCKKSGCDYFVEDFENMKIDVLEQILIEGNVSIVAALDFKKINGKLICNPILYLRERNINREVVDLLSMKTPCASLTPTGCIHTYEKRPSGGKYLVPKENMECYSEVNRLEKLKEWEKYQNTLARLVKRITKKSVNAKLREDVIKLLSDIECENFKNVAKEELYDIFNLVPLLIEAFPEEAKIAKSNCTHASTMVLHRK